MIAPGHFGVRIPALRWTMASCRTMPTVCSGRVGLKACRPDNGPDTIRALLRPQGASASRSSQVGRLLIVFGSHDWAWSAERFQLHSARLLLSADAYLHRTFCAGQKCQLYILRERP